MTCSPVWATDVVVAAPPFDWIRRALLGFAEEVVAMIPGRVLVWLPAADFVIAGRHYGEESDCEGDGEEQHRGRRCCGSKGRMVRAVRRGDASFPGLGSCSTDALYSRG